MPEVWRAAVTVLCNKDKGERNECKTHWGISLVSAVGKTDAGLLVDRVHRGNERLTDDA